MVLMALDLHTLSSVRGKAANDLPAVAAAAGHGAGRPLQLGAVIEEVVGAPDAAVLYEVGHAVHQRLRLAAHPVLLILVLRNLKSNHVVVRPIKDPNQSRILSSHETAASDWQPIEDQKPGGELHPSKAQCQRVLP